MIGAVIFDVDGTLVDSVDLHAEAWQRAFRKFGKEVPFEKIRFQIGKGSDEFLPEFWSAEEVEKLGKAIEEYRGELFEKEYLPRVRGFPKVRELFLHLRACGQKFALASSAKGTELQGYKKAAGIEDLIERETSSDDAERSKPNPDIFEAALEKLEHPRAEETLVVGDTPWDIEAARKAGLRTIAVRCGGFKDEDLRGAMAIFDDPADLLGRYEASPLAGD